MQSPRRSHAELFRGFIEELRQRGLEQRGEWPFNVAKLGFTSSCRYINRVLQQHPRRQRLTQPGIWIATSLAKPCVGLRCRLRWIRRSASTQPNDREWELAAMDRGRECLLEIERLQRLLIEGETQAMRQEMLITAMKQQGLDTAEAEKLLAAFKGTLTVMHQCLLTRFERCGGSSAQ